MATNLRTHNIWSFVEMRLAEEVVAYFIFGKIVNAKTTKETWDILKFSYKGEEKAQTSKLQSLQREYERYHISSFESMKQYFSCVTNLVNKMRVYGEDIPDNKVVKFGHVVTSIIKSHNIDTMTVVELQGSIERLVTRILEKTEKVSEEALKSQVNLNNVAKTSQNAENRGRDNFNNGRRGNFTGRGRGNYRGRG
ncbi:hypothetical protein GmHk_14G041812 [Glycine max]|nr:hypothetical protein GmHk_14G041812 [Glycine max]